MAQRIWVPNPFPRDDLEHWKVCSSVIVPSTTLAIKISKEVSKVLPSLCRIASGPLFCFLYAIKRHFDLIPLKYPLIYRITTANNQVALYMYQRRSSSIIMTKLQFVLSGLLITNSYTIQHMSCQLSMGLIADRL